MFLKVLIVSAVLAITQAATLSEKIVQADTFAKECITETGIEPEVAEKLKNADFSTRNEKAECFIKCLYEKIGFMDKEGTINKDAFLNTIKNDDKKKELDELITKCVSTKSENKCELAFNIFECYWTGRGTSLAKEFAKIQEVLAAGPPVPVPAPAPVPAVPLPAPPAVVAATV